ncbi:hypothetical protein E2C01_009379 [Portunus trituberculatus]|uniref:Uncharacterized protein n=1 Tax=Portunus trituberculatus TaxID=210409 RepID=A0A5B7D4G6_PORTR|nr:hypothetical protein [Portunus trituberculatus]
MQILNRYHQHYHYVRPAPFYQYSTPPPPTPQPTSTTAPKREAKRGPHSDQGTQRCTEQAEPP